MSRLGFSGVFVEMENPRPRVSKNPDKPWKPAIPKPEGWKPTEPLPRCQAWARQAGRQCLHHASVGAATCRNHGGEAPQLRRKYLREKALEQASASVGAVEPVTNIYEWAAYEAGKLKAQVGFLEERVGHFREADVQSPDFAALQQKQREVLKLVVDMSKINLEERKLIVPTMLRERLLTATRAAIADTVRDLKDLLPPEHRALADRLPNLFAQFLAKHLGDTTLDDAPREIEG